MIKIVKGHIGFHYYLYINTALYFDSFGNKYIFLVVLNKIRYKSITHNTLRMQDNESFMCGFYCILLLIPAKKCT